MEIKGFPRRSPQTGTLEIDAPLPALTPAYAKPRHLRHATDGTSKAASPIPYASATSGVAARDEVTKFLRGFGCESVGFMDSFGDSSVLLAFTHRGRQGRPRASASGWAQFYLKTHPWTSRMKTSATEHEARALRQGLIAVNSILRDWVKGQITAVECGVLPFEAVFLPHMLAPDGRPMLEKLREQRLLPAPLD